MASQGSYEETKALANTPTTQSNGAKYVCCESETSIKDVTLCNGASTMISGTPNAIGKRIIINWGKQGTLFKYGGANAAEQADINFTWNADLLVASMFSPSELATSAQRTNTGSIWCDKFETILNTDGTETTLVTNIGFGGKSKCTYQINTSINTHAP